MNFHKFLKIFIVFLLIFAWIFSGWPRIWQKPAIPPEIQEAQAQATTIYITDTAQTSWTVPSDWNSANNTIEVMGGGGGGYPDSGKADGGGGGGGGAYSKISNLALTPDGSVTIQVADGGAGGVNGEDTWFNGTTCAGSSVCAKGGLTGSLTTGGAGGAVADGVGTVKYSGGTGGNPNTGGDASGGGGGAAGPYGNGGNGGAGGGAVNDGGGGGGGNGGGYAGADGAAAGGDGGNNYNNTGGGAGGNGASGTAGTEGGGGGGSDKTFAGGAGGNGIDWDSTHGSGGGGGGTGDNGTGGGNGGLYGGGGGGDTGTAAGSGAQGIIVIIYTPTTPTLDITAPSNVQMPNYTLGGVGYSERNFSDVSALVQVTANVGFTVTVSSTNLTGTNNTILASNIKLKTDGTTSSNPTQIINCSGFSGITETASGEYSLDSTRTIVTTSSGSGTCDIYPTIRVYINNFNIYVEEDTGTLTFTVTSP